LLRGLRILRSVAIGQSSSVKPRTRNLLIGLGAVVTAALLCVVAGALAWSGATLGGDPTALASVSVQPFGGKLESERALGPDGRPIALAVSHGRLTPLTQLTPGEQVTVEVVIRRPGWLSWALGHTRRESLTVTAPVAHVSDRWPVTPSNSPIRVKFDRPVAAVAYGTAGQLGQRTAVTSVDTVAIPRTTAAGTMQVAAAARSWERLGAPVSVSWFPASRSPVAVASPAPGAQVSPALPLRLTFSKPVADVLGSKRPRLSPSTAGSWHEADSHTLVFTPTGFGAGFGTHIRLDLPRAMRVEGRGTRPTRQIDWTVPQGSPLRLEQLLAESGYLPVNWTAAGAPVPRDAAAQLQAAITPPQGTFVWRWQDTPAELRDMWKPEEPNQITRGAVMMFENTHGLTADGLAGPAVWKALLADVMAGKHRNAGYSYVYVHRSLPQSLTLWHNGRTILRSPGNTGVPAAPTQLGTFPVFEHLASGTMSGTNPDGSKYNDPGIKWISYFNGGDALHAFPRASFGTPQSLGCVELPLASAAKVWPYTPIGTLVTIEN
jgi:L,D-transpeptidase catalytic domain